MSFLERVKKDIPIMNDGSKKESFLLII